MATTFTKVPLIRLAAVRGYSCPTGGSASPIPGISNYEVQTTVLPNKTVVVSAENESPISRISILYRAGSRNESADNQGATHVLRVAAGTSTCSASSFAITRQLQQNAANLYCTTSREIVAYTLEGLRKSVQASVPFLTAVATEQEFRPWELSDLSPRLRLELANRPPQLRVVDLLHKAAYRNGLGNSLYIAKYNLEKVSSETLQHYVASTFTANRAAIVGIGVDHSALVKYAQCLDLQPGNENTGSGKYRGGEIRSDKGGDRAFVAVAGEGGALKNPQEALAFAVLQRAYGIGASTKRGIGSAGVLRTAVGSVDAPHSIAGLNVNYSDSGLFGVIMAAPHNVIGKLVISAIKTLKSGTVPDADIARGKNQLKFDALSAIENASCAIEKMGEQALTLACGMSPADMIEEIDKLSPEDIKAAAKKVSSSKLSIASVGNLSEVPFLDEV